MADFDPKDPLARIKGESIKANTALRDYYKMGGGRSLNNLLALYVQQASSEAGTKPPTRFKNTLATWSVRFSWQDRLSVQLELDDITLKEEMIERQKDVIQMDWDIGQQVRDLASAILAEAVNFVKTKRRLLKGSPKVVDTNGLVLDPGKPDREILTMAIDGNLLIRALTIASKLQRLSSGMESDRRGLQLSGTVNTRTGIDWDNLDDDQLNAYFERLSNLDDPPNFYQADDTAGGNFEGADSEGQIPESIDA